MQNFTLALNQKLQFLSQFSDLDIQLNSPAFRLKKGKVSQFMQEIQQTGHQLSEQKESIYAEIYAQKLVQQFDLLNKAVKQQNRPQTQVPTFRSHYRFPKNIHNLPIEKRLREYQKALRLLNEKLTWLAEQAQSANEETRHIFISQIQETEYRKNKCLMEIDKLDGRN